MQTDSLTPHVVQRTYRTVVEPGYSDTHPAVREASGDTPEGYRTFRVWSEADTRQRRWMRAEWTIEARDAEEAGYAANVLHAERVGFRSTWNHSVLEVA